ncbi:MAG: SUMF1/EgtB/PvdO family nonheme iron enzyme, partial [Phycisphaerae bacterium]
MARTIEGLPGMKAAAWAAGLVLVAAACHLSERQGRSAPASGEATTAADMKPYTEEIPGADVSFEMLPVRAGRFVMGSPAGEPNRSKDEGPQVEVELAPFWMGRCEVTWDEFELWAMGLDQYRRAAPEATWTARDRQADAVTRATPPYGDCTFGMGRQGCP